jgi:hypothetical protein
VGIYPLRRGLPPSLFVISCDILMEVTEKIREKIEVAENPELSLKDIYTPLSEARKEIWRRWNDKALRQKVKDFLGGDVPEIFGGSPKAVLARHVASPTYEFRNFLDLASLSGLDFVCLEYLGDKFRSMNPSKYYLGKLFFSDGMGKNGGERVNAVKVVDFDGSEGRKISDLKTLGGENFVDFHHGILHAEGIDVDEKRLFDLSGWYGRNGGSAKKYYSRYFSLFICYGILFENYMLSKGEGEFTREVVLPSFDAVSDFFGVKPLIVPLVPIEEEDDPHAWYYPYDLKAKIESKNTKVYGF